MGESTVSATNAFAKEMALIIAEELKRSKPTKELYTVEEASIYLGCSAQQVRNFINARRIPVVKIDQRPRLRVRDLERFVEAAKE